MNPGSLQGGPFGTDAGFPPRRESGLARYGSMMLPYLMPPPAPTSSLDLVQRLVRERLYRITVSAAEGARRLLFDESDIVDCVLALTPTDFYKTMPSAKQPGSMQDVYRTRWDGFAVYVKVQVRGDRTIIISFKQDESA